MNMPHISEANRRGKDLQAIAVMNNPDALVAMAREYNEQGKNTVGGFVALASIAARAYWLQINGQWVKK